MHQSCALWVFWTLEYVCVNADVGYECFCGIEFKLVETRLQNSAVIGQFTDDLMSA